MKLRNRRYSTRVHRSQRFLWALAFCAHSMDRTRSTSVDLNEKSKAATSTVTAAAATASQRIHNKQCAEKECCMRLSLKQKKCATRSCARSIKNNLLLNSGIPWVSLLLYYYNYVFSFANIKSGPAAAVAGSSTRATAHSNQKAVWLA